MKRRDLANDHAAGSRSAGANPNVVAAGNHVAHGIVEVQLELDAGVAPAKGRNERQDIVSSERRQARHLQRAGWRSAFFGYRRLRILQFAQRAGAAFVVSPPFLRQRQLARRSVQQAHAKLPFQALHILAHSNRSDTQLLSCAGETPRLDRAHESNYAADALHQVTTPNLWLGKIVAELS